MVNKKNTVFKLFANCQVVNGVSRSIICDLNGKVFIIPAKYNDYIPLFKDSNGIACERIEKTEKLKELVDELEYKQMGIYLSKDIAKNLPNIEIQWNSPHPITNAIVDFDNTHVYNWGKFITGLDVIGCPFIQVRVFNKASFEQLDSVFKAIDSTDIFSVQLIIPFSNSKDFWVDISTLVKNHSRIADAIVYNCSIDPAIPSDLKNRIRSTNEEVYNADSCGCISSAFFTLKVDFFYESHLYNNCLNRKIAISSEGLVKNCPSMKSDYGNIDDVSLLDIVRSDKFQFWGTIKKDDIETCKDCEFRYICSDCRVFTVKDSPYSKPSKCPYDPITCTGF
jgi:SPASM domain peptide maturase of grasp-with-spasm system